MEGTQSTGSKAAGAGSEGCAHSRGEPPCSIADPLPALRSLHTEARPSTIDRPTLLQALVKKQVADHTRDVKGQWRNRLTRAEQQRMAAYRKKKVRPRSGACVRCRAQIRFCLPFLVPPSPSSSYVGIPSCPPPRPFTCHTFCRDGAGGYHHGALGRDAG